MSDLHVALLAALAVVGDALEGLARTGAAPGVIRVVSRSESAIVTPEDPREPIIDTPDEMRAAIVARFMDNAAAGRNAENEALVQVITSRQRAHQTTFGAGDPDTPAPTVHRYPLPGADGVLSWRDADGEPLTVRPVTRDSCRLGAGPVSTVVIAGHEVSLWDARMIGSYLGDLYRALNR